MGRTCCEILQQVTVLSEHCRRRWDRQQGEDRTDVSAVGRPAGGGLWVV